MMKVNVNITKIDKNNQNLYNFVIVYSFKKKKNSLYKYLKINGVIKKNNLFYNK